MGTVSSLSLPFIEQPGLNSSTQAESGKNSTASMVIGKSEFLELLITQLKHQDPMNPVNNEQFIMQLATFSQLEQLISINQAVTRLAEHPDAEELFANPAKELE